ncbi:MAG TPA: hypothetical protein VNZ27_10035 [Rhodanobacter sp.]|jgi:hypothetical protein|nr:hypothetical protein [Rhodanobacter sp.]
MSNESQGTISRRKAITMLGATALVGTYSLKASAQVAAQNLLIVNTVQDLRNISVNNNAIQILGRTQLGDGGGLFYWDPNSALPEDGGIIFQSSTLASGSNGRWVRFFLKTDGIEPSWFGCVSDGATDDTLAFQATVNAAFLWDAKIRVPRGKTKITSDIQLSGNPIIEGDSPQTSELVFFNNSGIRYLNGAVSEYSSNNQVEIRHAGFRCADQKNSTAIIDLRFTGGNGTTSQSVILEDVEVTGNAGNTGFTKAVYLSNARNIKVRGMRISGNASEADWSGTHGLYLDGNAQPVEFYISDCNFYNVDAGIYVNGLGASQGIEGVYITQCSFVSCNYGVYASGSVTHPLIKVNGSQFNCFYSNVYAYNYVHLMITSNVFYAAGPRLGKPHICISIGANQPNGGFTSIISSNIILGSNFTGQPKNGIVIGGSGLFSILISDNYIGGYDTPIWLTSGSNSVVVAASNQLIGNYSNCVRDDGVNNTVSLTKC